MFWYGTVHASHPGVLCADVAGAGSVLCPVCKSCQLVQRQGLLVCPSEGWRLNLAKEGVSMDTIMTNLATAYEVCSVTVHCQLHPCRGV
jgi:hypothetical protein